MLYLKCNKCGHYNEVKTEYQTFCSNCNKKLENNYSDWKVVNPDGNFEDFKLMVCVSNIEASPNPAKSKSNNPKKVKYWIGVGLGFVIAFSVFYALGKIGGEAISNYFTKSVDKKMMEVASEINKSCPVMVDGQTRLDNTIALPNNTFQYNFTIVNIAKDEINIDEAINQLKPSIKNYVKTTPDMKLMRDNKMTINYSYKDKNGVFLFTISITPNDYN